MRRCPDSELDIGLLEVFAFGFRLDTDDDGLIDQRAISRVVEGQLTAIWQSPPTGKSAVEVPNRTQDNSPIHHLTANRFVVRVKRDERGWGNAGVYARCVGQQEQARERERAEGVHVLDSHTCRVMRQAQGEGKEGSMDE